MLSAGFEPEVPPNERPQTYVFHPSATGICTNKFTSSSELLTVRPDRHNPYHQVWCNYHSTDVCSKTDEKTKEDRSQKLKTDCIWNTPSALLRSSIDFLCCNIVQFINSIVFTLRWKPAKWQLWKLKWKVSALSGDWRPFAGRIIQFVLNVLMFSGDKASLSF